MAFSKMHFIIVAFVFAVGIHFSAAHPLSKLNMPIVPVQQDWTPLIDNQDSMLGPKAVSMPRNQDFSQYGQSINNQKSIQAEVVPPEKTLSDSETEMIIQRVVKREEKVTNVEDAKEKSTEEKKINNEKLEGKQTVINEPCQPKENKEILKDLVDIKVDANKNFVSMENNDEMDVAENNIVFRPLFKYRQQSAQRSRYSRNFEDY